ncbi:NAD-dependent epimerase/dehydratase family protein [Agromyces bauzanensis]
MARALVIGANGFIGSSLVDALAREGHEVTAFDRFSAGTRSFTADARMVRGDFLNTADLRTAVSGQDLVFHFLSTTTPMSAQGDPTIDLRTNVLQTVTLLELCSEAGVEHVYYASTGGAIYGDQGRERYVESDPTMPRSPYAIGKATIEGYLRYFKAVHGLNSTSLRISNPYGGRQPRARMQGLIPIVVRQALSGEVVTRFGDGSMLRDYVYVDDLVDMVVNMVAKRPVHDVYNLGSGVGASVTEVLRIVADVTRRRLQIVERPTPATFVERVVLDIARYSAEYGKPPVRTLEDGIRRTVADIRRQERMND